MIPGMGYVFTGKSIKKFFVQKIVRFLYRNTLKFSHHVFFQNKDDHEYFLRYKLVSSDKTSVIPGTGVDIVKFRPMKRKEKKNITFMIAARMLWDKGIGEFVEAARIIREKYDNVDFWLLGPVDLQNPKGIKPEQLDQWRREGLVTYLGMTDDIKSFYAKADVIVLPSYYKEGIPLSLLEGAAMGKPIISTDSTGCRDVVENGKNGYLVPVRDAVQLALAMERFITDPFKIKIMGEQSRKMAVAKFDSQRIVTQILKYYPI
jgi:glycosyltransferase involved in cell wall biosynthesis